MAKTKGMPWLKARLYVVGKSPASLARHLGIEGPRVYEMIGGRRRMQPEEIAPTADFLEWSIDELLTYLPPDQVVPAHIIYPSIASQQSHRHRRQRHRG